MLAIKLTKQQEFAVNENGNILVAAAAGSGKTAVLVERVIKKLTSKENPISADRLLIVTFTNAAAAEMRTRIEKRLDEECRNNSDNVSLMLQKRLLSSAKICTIDSFCIDLVRENFEKAGVSPDFSIMDGFSIKGINAKIVAEIVDEYFKQNDPDFVSLLDIIGAEFDEKTFCNFVLDLYEYSRQMPFPERWYDSLLEFYDGGRFSNENPWRLYALDKALKIVEDLKKSLVVATDLLMSNSAAADARLPRYSDVAMQLEAINDACKKRNWDLIVDLLRNFSFLPVKAVRGVKGIWEIDTSDNILQYIKTEITENLTKLFYEKEAFINSQFKKIYPALVLLVNIVKEFDRRVLEELKNENKFTFHHIEHFALNILCEVKDGTVTVKQGAEEFLDCYDEVCVDEYQDTNDLQNMLFYILSDRDRKLFAVGDVKQSIYGFRGANPAHFLERKKRHIPVSKASENDPKKIILGHNFRCKPQVCDFINYFFEIFMTQETGEINYDSEERLIAAAEYPKTDFPAVSIDIINSTDNEIKDLIIETRAIANYIKKVMNSGAVIRDGKNELRKAKYSDFTILLRSMKNKASVITTELKNQGVPANYNAEGFIEFAEIATMLSLLRVIDNPTNDIELLALLMSPIFGFSSEDIAKIRIEKRDSSLYSAICVAADSGDEKIISFLDTIKKFRLYSVINPLPKLIDILLGETGLIDTVTVFSDGSRRKNNLLLLGEYANQYYAMGKSSISGFVDFIVKQSESGIKSAVSDSGEDTVKIMSIHASKGLQFPVCIIANTSKNFYVSERGEKNVLSVDNGIGFKYFDEENKEKYTTLGREVILDSIVEANKQEELRLLYVAMTRTQDFLYITSTLPNTEKKFGDTKIKILSSEGKVDHQVWNKCSSYSDWLLTSLMLHPDGKELRGTATAIINKETTSQVDLNIIDSVTLSVAEATSKTESVEIDERLTNRIKENISYEYPFKELTNVESKSSVSELAHKAESNKYAFTTLPSFMSEDGMNAARRGTAMHKVMEFFDFSKWQNPEEEIDRLYEWQFLTEEEAKSLNISALKRFFESDIFSRILRSETVKREMRFLTELPAKTVNSELSNQFDSENIIVQGAVDICFIEDDGVVILDFKTDRTDDPQDLINAYSEQLRIYALACEKIFEKPVKETKIYSFFQNKEIDV